MPDRPIVVLYREDVTAERLDSYAEAIEAAGGNAVTASPDADPEIAERIGEFAGVVLTGGVDIDPAIYGEEQHERVRQVDRVRDDYELRVLRAALARDLPVLGICRGHQLLNVAFGGKLLQHIEDNSHRSERGTLASTWHEARLTPGSRLAAIQGVERLHVNSRHHQAVTPATLAPGLVVAATTDDGVIEGLESPEHRFAVSVQWHPEREEMAEDGAPLFRAFVAAAKRR